MYRLLDTLPLYLYYELLMRVSVKFKLSCTVVYFSVVDNTRAIRQYQIAIAKFVYKIQCIYRLKIIHLCTLK